jgi:type III secretion protein F
MSFNFDDINASMGQRTSAAESELRSFSETMDPNNSADLISFQQKIQEWSLITGLQSTTIKSLKDALQSIIQKT